MRRLLADIDLAELAELCAYDDIEPLDKSDYYQAQVAYMIACVLYAFGASKTRPKLEEFLLFSEIEGPRQQTAEEQLEMMRGLAAIFGKA